MGPRRARQYGTADGDFADLINRDFKRLSARYLQLLEAAWTLTPGFEEVYYNAWNGFTLQFPLILAAVTPVNDGEVFQAKVRIMASFIDLFVARRMVSFRNFGYNTVQYTMFNLIKEIRDLDPTELADTFGNRVADLEGDFAAAENYRLHQRNSNQVKYLLARLTAWLESGCGGITTFADLVDRAGKTHSRSSTSGPTTQSCIPSSTPSKNSLIRETSSGHCSYFPGHSTRATEINLTVRNCRTTSHTTYLPGHSIHAVTRITPVSSS